MDLYELDQQILMELIWHLPLDVLKEMKNCFSGRSDYYNRFLELVRPRELYEPEDVGIQDNCDVYLKMNKLRFYQLIDKYVERYLAGDGKGDRKKSWIWKLR